MEKLKLAAPFDDKPQTHGRTSAQVHRDLIAYADYLNSQLSQSHLFGG